MPARMPDPPGDPRLILVLSPNWLGDAVMALPAIADLKRHFASARIVVAARRSLADVFRLSPAVDDVLPLLWGGRLLRTQSLRADLASLREAGAPIAILLPNSFASAWMVRRSGVEHRWGYATDFRRPLLTRAVHRPRGSMHQAAYYQHLVRELGIPSGPLEPTLIVRDVPAAVGRLPTALRESDESRPLVTLAPGAAYGTAKRWIPAHFARLVTMLIAQGARCVLVGSGGDRETTQWVHSLLGERERAETYDLAGQTSLLELAGVMSVSRVFVSNDSGAMHMASALGVPVVALFGPTREYETAPIARQGRRAEVLLHPVWCRPCMLRECPIDHRCMKGLTPERVFAMVSEVMQGRGAHERAR
jgi:heptosyltransferase-2